MPTLYGTVTGGKIELPAPAGWADGTSVRVEVAAVAPLLTQPEVDREMVSALWSICHLARVWGVSPGGMLQSNGLITAEDVARLESWVEHISYATMALLDRSDVDVAFDAYRLECGT